MLPELHKQELDFRGLEALKVLVADDAELNRYLVKHILGSWGCEVILAGSGQEVIDKLAGQHFDLILMDIQMPGIDGITATKMIRALSVDDKPVIGRSAVTKKISAGIAKDRSATPIIALTAHTQKGDSERYLEAGMNGYISKPYTEEKLFRVITDVINATGMLHENAANDTGTGPDTPLYDLSLLNSMGNEDNKFTKTIAGIFNDTMPESVIELRNALADNNRIQARKTAHKMKSSLDLLGVHSLKETIRKLETTDDNEEISAYIEILDTTLQKVYAQLKEIL